MKNTYSEMKDSGVEWLGDIPRHWQLTDIGSLYTQRNERVSDKEYAPLSVTKQGILPQLATVAKTDDGDNRKLVKCGDFVINSRSDRRGSCGISPYNGSVSLINTVLSPRCEMHPNYFDWLFHTEFFADEFYKWGHGIVDDLWTTRWTEMKQIVIPVPEFTTQTVIAAYLDEKCGTIDEIIAEAKASIEEYKAWKSSVIFEAVTKGLDLHAEMKDSGVEWIGKVPREANIVRLRIFISKIESGVSVNAGQEPAQANEIGVLKTSSVSQYIFIPSENKNVNKDELSRVSCPVKKNTLIVSRMNTPELVGACGYVDDDYENLFLPDRLWQVHLNETCNTKFIWYYLRSNFVRNYYASLSTGTSSSMQNISQSQFSNVQVVNHPYDMQKKIADYLDEKCAAIDGIIAEKEALIADMEAYKKSLIFETVTGKRKVC